MYKTFLEAETIEKTEHDEELKEKKVNNILNGSTSIGQIICKKEIESHHNALNVMILSGSKGSYINSCQIRGLLGQQNIDGGRIPFHYGDRTLPHYNNKLYDKNIELNDRYKRLNYESRGFVSSCFISGLNPQEFYMHAQAGRIGIIDTSIKTATSGYMQRRLVKKMEDLVMSYLPGIIVDCSQKVVQFNYENNLDPAKLVKVGRRMSFINVSNVCNKLNTDYEFENHNNLLELD